MPACATRRTVAEDRPRRFLLGLREALVELRDEAVSIERESIGVTTQERPRVGAARQDVEAIFFERPQVPLTQASQAFGVGKDEALRLASRSQTRTDVEQAVRTLAAEVGRQGSASSTLPSCRTIPSIRTSIGSPSRYLRPERRPTSAVPVGFSSKNSPGSLRAGRKPS